MINWYMLILCFHMLHAYLYSFYKSMHIFTIRYTKIPILHMILTKVVNIL